MVIKEHCVLNSANLSMWMVNVSQAMLVTSGEKSILDLKARHHGLRYARKYLKYFLKTQNRLILCSYLKRFLS